MIALGSLEGKGESAHRIRFPSHAARMLALVAALHGVLASPGCVRRFLYDPDAYKPKLLEDYRNREGAHEFVYETSQGRQTAFYFAPDTGPGELPESLIAMFGGNGAVALGWLGFIDPPPRESVGFLLVEYPGYGLCEGTPGRRAIRESSLAALDGLAGLLSADREDLEERLYLIGHSLGSATALEFAVERRARHVVLISPFTTMEELVKTRWRILLASTLGEEDFDNSARVRELSRSTRPPELTVIHGAKDRVIPVRMGRRIAELYPRERVAYRELPDRGHYGLMSEALAIAFERIFETSAGESATPVAPR